MPDQFFLQPTKHSPNSPLPILLYRNVLPQPYSEATTTKFLEANDWEKRVRRVTSYNSIIQFTFNLILLLGDVGSYSYPPLSSKLS